VLEGVAEGVGACQTDKRWVEMGVGLLDLQPARCLELRLRPAPLDLGLDGGNQVGLCVGSDGVQQRAIPGAEGWLALEDEVALHSHAVHLRASDERRWVKEAHTRNECANTDCAASYRVNEDVGGQEAATVPCLVVGQARRRGFTLPLPTPEEEPKDSRNADGKRRKRDRQHDAQEEN
jgi:hypothetical protein